MTKTSTTYTPSLRQNGPEKGKKSRRNTKNGEAMLGSYGRNTQNGDKADIHSLTLLPKIRQTGRSQSQVASFQTPQLTGAREARSVERIGSIQESPEKDHAKLSKTVNNSQEELILSS